VVDVLALKKLCVLHSEWFGVFAQFVDGVDGIGGTNRHAGSAVNATLGVDEQLGRGLEARVVFLRMNAVGGADVDTKEIFDAGVGNHIGHDGFLDGELESCDP
jgi:hypothetical protein